MDKDLITTQQAAEILGVDTSTLRKWRQRKLFGVPFFTADVKDNGAWYYYRDRVEQLKDVYQPGILQHMYKLAKLETDKVKLFDFCVTSADIGYLKEIILDVDDVAKILGITARHVRRLCDENKLEWYGEHDGTYWLNAYDVYKFKAAEKNLKSRKLSDIEFVKLTHPAVLASMTPPMIRFVAGKDNEVVCPFCGNGSGNSRTGLTFKQYPDGYKYFCWKCHSPYDNLDFAANFFGVELKGNAFKEVAKKTRQLIENVPADAIPKHFESTEYIPPKQIKDYAQFLNSANKNLKNFVDSQGGKWRGLIYETLNRFYCGYAEYFGTPQTPRVIIPSSRNHFLARFVGDLNRYSDEEKVKIHEKQHCGAKDIFSYDRDVIRRFQRKIYEEKIKPENLTYVTFDPIFVLEGEIDAMSGYQLTEGKIPFTALGGASITASQFEYLKSANLSIPLIYILMLDNDAAGNDKAPSVANQLASIPNKKVVVQKLGTYDDNGNFEPLKDDSGNIIKDINDGLQHCPDTTKEILQRIFDKVKSYARNIDNYLDIFVNPTAQIDSLADHNADTSTGDNLKNQLRDAKQKLADFDAEKSAAIETLKNVENFDNKTVFSDEIVNAAAFCKIFDLQTYLTFYRDLKAFGDKHRTDKVNLRDFQALVLNKAALITDRQNKLNAELVKINAEIATDNFIADNPELQNITIPNGYSFSLDGITKIIDDKGNTAQVSFAPVIITGKSKNIDDKTFKLILQFWTRDGRKIALPAMPSSSIFNARKIIDLANYDLPVNSMTAFRLTEFLDAFKVENDSVLPTTCIAPRCGWYNFNGTDIFLDPRRSVTVTDDAKSCPLIVDNTSTFAQSLTTKGSLAEWIKAYNLAKSSPIARLTVAAAVAPPLLKILGERNFLLYVYGQTRSGKSSILYLGASAVGDENMIRNFDGTKNGLIGAAADVSDYPFFVDEKQSADNRLQDSMALIVYSWSNGVGRTRLNKDSSLKKLQNWRTIAIANGETPLFSDNVTGGAYTRCLQLHAPNTILDAEICKQIRDIIKDHYGHAFPLVIDKIFEYGKDKLREQFNIITDKFSKIHSDILPEYRRYLGLLTLADSILNICLGVDEETADNDALNNARAIFKLTPTNADIDDTTRETDFIFGFIAQNQSRFIGGNVALEKMQQIFGKIDNDFIYITVAAMKTACSDNNFNFDKTIEDLITAGVIIPSDKIEKNRKKPLNTHVIKLEKTATRCYKVSILKNGYTV